jgi:hypothetical protein
LTAEAVSDVLERPLYSISLGELGNNAKALEENLKSLLDLAEVRAIPSKLRAID